MKVRSAPSGPKHSAPSVGTEPHDTTLASARASNPGFSLDGYSRSLLSRSTSEDLSSLRVHTGPAITSIVDRLGARAFTIGHDLYFGPGAYAPETASGRELLAHEVAHSMQQTQTGLRRGGTQLAERDADRFAARVIAGRQASVSIGAPVAPAFRPKGAPKQVVDPEPEFRRGDLVTGMRVVADPLGEGSVTITTKLGDTFTYTLKENSIPAGAYKARPRGGGDIDVFGVTGRIVLRYTGQPDPATLMFAKKFDLVVVQTGFGGGGSGGTTGAQTPAAPTTTTPLPANPKDDSGITITVDNPDQIDELKKLGLHVDNDSPSNKSKVTLTFEQAKQLLDALNKVKSPGGEKSAADAPTWLDWAKFVEENKDKISGGPAGTSDTGLTLDEVKQTLAKYKKFVGVEKGAQHATVKDRIKDPALAESWNSLHDWERKMWEDYAKEFPDVQADDGRTDLRITAADKQRIAIKLSWKYFPEGFKEQAKALFSDPLFYVTTFASIMIYVALWLNPEPIFSKAAAAALTVALLALFSMSEILNFARAWGAIGDETEYATTMAELETAAEHFGKRMGGAGFRVLFMIFTWLLGKTLPKPVPGTGGGGLPPEPAAVPAGGPGGAVSIAVEGGVTVKVLADGTVVIVGLPAGAQAVMSGKAAGSGGGGGKPEAPSDTESKTDPKTEPKPAEPIVKGSPASVKAWKATLNTRPAVQGSTPQGQYQIRKCGPTEYEITGGGEKVYADGLDDATTAAREAKYIKNPDRSPWVDDSDTPEKIRALINADTIDEFRRYGAVINSPDSPLTWLRVIVSDARAMPFFQRLLTRFSIPGEVVFEP